jgi:flagellar motility protein MotE (MotC chaperone)
VLAKLNPRAASDILAEMPADKAARLSTLLAGALSAEKS